MYILGKTQRRGRLSFLFKAGVCYKYGPEQGSVNSKIWFRRICTSWIVAITAACCRVLADHIRTVHVAALCPCALQRPHLYFFGGRAALPPISPRDRMRFVLSLPAPTEECGTARRQDRDRSGCPVGVDEEGRDVDDAPSRKVTRLHALLRHNLCAGPFSLF